MKLEVDVFGAFGFIVSEGFSFEMFEMVYNETIMENITINAITNATCTQLC